MSLAYVEPYEGSYVESYGGAYVWFLWACALVAISVSHSGCSTLWKKSFNTLDALGSSAVA